MKFTLTIHCDNAAFEDGGRDAEVIRLLRRAIDHFEVSGDALPLFDVNGNFVGIAGFEDGESEEQS